MADFPLPNGLTEAEVALFGLVAALESDDYRNPAGVPALTTAAYLDAKTLVCLLVLLGRGPASQH